jgi:hypothetical protein
MPGSTTVRGGPGAETAVNLRLWLRRYAAGHGQRRVVWAALAAWVAGWGLAHAPTVGYSWHYFTFGAELLTGPSTVVGAGLHVYAAHPELQIGPLALALAVPFSWAGPTIGLALAVVVLSAMGMLILKILVSTAELRAPVSDPLLLLTGVCFLPVWAELATHFTHLDDALTLGFAAAALYAVKTDRPIAVGLLLAAAIDSKPWAIAFLPLILALVPQHRKRSALACLSGILLLWLPFAIADPRTLSLSHFSIVNAADSSLRAIGVTSPGTPSWDRLAQAMLGVTAAALAIRRGRWPAVLLAGVTARMLFDPQTYPYYTAGLAAAAAAVDLLRPGRRLPLWTLGAAAFYLMTTAGHLILQAQTLGQLRALYCIAVLVLLCTPGPQACAPDLPADDHICRRQATGASRARDSVGTNNFGVAGHAGMGGWAGTMSEGPSAAHFGSGPVERKNGQNGTVPQIYDNPSSMRPEQVLASKFRRPWVPARGAD